MIQQFDDLREIFFSYLKVIFVFTFIVMLRMPGKGCLCLDRSGRSLSRDQGRDQKSPFTLAGFKALSKQEV